MQPPADNPAAGSAAVNRIGQGVNPNILATPRACYPWPGRQSAQGIRLQPPADNPAAGSAAVNRIGQGVNPNILATPATPRACYPWPAASISARNPVATPR